MKGPAAGVARADARCVLIVRINLDIESDLYRYAARWQLISDTVFVLGIYDSRGRCGARVMSNHAALSVQSMEQSLS